MFIPGSLSNLVCFMQDGSGEKVVKNLIPIARSPANEVVATGENVHGETGHWLLVFDNSYSIVRGKNVWYHCTV